MRSLRRESVEYALQRELAVQFKAEGNFKRAAIHEHKAAALAKFRNPSDAGQ